MSSMIINAPRFGEQLVCWPIGNFSYSVSGHGYDASGLTADFSFQATGITEIPANQRVRVESQLNGRTIASLTVSGFGAITPLLPILRVTGYYPWDAGSCFSAATENLEWTVYVDCGDSSLPSANVTSTTQSSTQQTTIDHATAGQQCTSPTYYYYDMEDCADGTTFVGRSTTSGLSVGASFSYGLASDPDCAKITGTNSTATSGTGFITTYTDCCGCMEANKCRSTSGFTTPTSAHTVYASGNLQQVIGTQITPSPGYPSGYVINEYTKVTVEGELGGRTVQSAVLSDFGASTSTYPSGVSTTVYHAYDDSSNQCFTNATETIRWRLKVECGSWSGSAITSCSTAYTAWQSATVDHSSAGEQCTGGTLYEVTDCFDSSTHLVEDSSSYGVSSGDFVDFYDSSSNQRCGTITATNQSGSANGAYINWYGYTDCSDCVSSTGISNPTLYTATDCNDSSATYILADDQYSVLPSTGDVVAVYLNSGDYACVTITGTTSSGTSAGYLEGGYSDCASCSSYNGLTLYTVQECGSDTLEVINDNGSLSPSAGDVVSYYRDSSGTTHCGTIGGVTTNGPASGETSSGYNDCAECISYEGL